MFHLRHFKHGAKFNILSYLYPSLIIIFFILFILWINRRIDKWRHLSKLFRKLIRTNFRQFSRDGAKSLFFPIYPFSSIFCPFFLCFICGTLKMALNSIFLFYLCPFLIAYFPCLTCSTNLNRLKRDFRYLSIRNLYKIYSVQFLYIIKIL